jgi:hypothetical protein
MWPREPPAGERTPPARLAGAIVSELTVPFTPIQNWLDITQLVSGPVTHTELVWAPKPAPIIK